MHAYIHTCIHTYIQFKYKASSTGGRDAVDLVRLMKILYTLTTPNGKYKPSEYKPPKDGQPKPNNVINQANAVSNPHPPRISHVEVAKFKKTKMLGQGGQGTVHLGSYDGIPCAGKTFLGTPDQHLVQVCVCVCVLRAFLYVY